MEMHAKRRKEREKTISDFFQWGIEDGYFRQGTNFAIITEVVQNAMTYIIETGMYNKYSFQSIFDNTILVFIRDMCTEKGIQIVDEKSSRRR